ncbi:MAG: hypothetical protein IPQ07_40905 [Myxococcales bacterium]|nr:hypothetical protein [Myxococcales bacterium]
MTPDDGELWTDDVTSVRCWTTSNVVCTKRLEVPSGFSCLGVALTASGNVITTFRPANGANTNPEIVVLAPKTGRVVSRRKQVHMGVIVAGEIIVAADSEAKRFVFFDEELREMGATPMASLEGYARLVPLWSDGKSSSLSTASTNSTTTVLRRWRLVTRPARRRRRAPWRRRNPRRRSLR